MTMKRGRYMGGVRTLEDLRQRCHIDADTGCWLWGMGTSNGRPCVSILLPDGRKSSVSALRAAFAFSRGVHPAAVPRDQVVWHKPSCSRPDRCINPAHAKIGLQGQMRQERGIGKRGTYAWHASVRNGLIHRDRVAKLTAAQAEEMRRLRHLPRVELARRFGVCLATVYKVLGFQTWRDSVAQGTSVFSYRPEVK